MESSNVYRELIFSDVSGKQGLVKRIEITEGLDYQYIAVGIASNERIWKLCYEINQSMGINLSEKEQKPPVSSEKPARTSPSLFDPGAISKEDRPLDYYEDMTSKPPLEYILRKPDTTQLPKETRPFRFFLLIRSVSGPVPEAREVIMQLSSASAVLSAVDISHIRNIKQLFF